ncbi:MAG: putative esterase [Clostridiaceae bacterium]|jgi:predicted alpha/beta superfamily hydrolase|nr:putative esterase [Clostridiaceae bacterium]
MKKGTINNLNICGCPCTLYLPQGYQTSGTNYSVVYMNGENEISEIMEAMEPHFDVDCEEFILVDVHSENWGSDYTPWPAPALAKKAEPFTGGASEYLNFLINKIKPYIDENYKTKPEPENTALIGYSLAGLAALYGLYTTEVFGIVGSLSGSLWYDGWIEFMNSNEPVNVHSKVYLSLGKGEEHNRNQRMAAVGSCTQKAFDILERQLESAENVTLQWNNGGHFVEIPERFHKAFAWLMGTDQKQL